MKDLYINDLTFEKVAGSYSIYLDTDSTKWIKKIVAEFLTNYPMLQQQVVGINWIKKDTKKGYAVGTMKVLNGMIPLIVKDFSLAPMDMILFDNYCIPLTAESINELLASPTPFKAIGNANAKASLALFGDKLQFSPVDYTNIADLGQNNSITRDAVKIASFIDRIEHVDKESINQILAEVEPIRYNFTENRTDEVLYKLATKNTFTRENIAESLLRESAIDRQMSFIDNKGNMFVKQANAKIDYTWEIKANDLSNEDRKWIGSDYNNTVEKVAHVEDEASTPRVGSFGHFKLGEQVTPEFEILNIQKYQELENCALFPYIEKQGALYIDKNSNYVDVPANLVKYAFSKMEIHGYEPNIGDYGTFYIDGKVTRPFEVVGIQKVATKSGIQFEVTGMTGLEKVAYYPTKASHKGLMAHEYEKNAFYVPKQSLFLKLGNSLGDYTYLHKEIEKKATLSYQYPILRFDVLEGLEKKAYYLTDGTSICNVDNSTDAYFVPLSADFVKLGSHKNYEHISDHTVRRDTSGLYSLHGEEFSKYAKLHDTNSLHKNDVLWSLTHCGANIDDIDKVAEMKLGEEYILTNAVKAPTPVEEILKVAEEFYDLYKDDISRLRKNLVKEASVLVDKSTVDAVLSLGLIKKVNILEYLQLIPDYERVCGELAKLLLMTRLGLTQISEVPVKTAMEALTSTTYALKQLQQIINTGGSSKI